MDLDYIQKYTFPLITGGGSGGIPFTMDSSILTTSLIGGGSISHLAIPGGLIYRPIVCESGVLEKDPWTVGIREDFDSLLDLVSVSASKNNRTVKKKS